MNMVGEIRSQKILFCMLKIKESMVERFTFLVFH